MFSALIPVYLAGKPQNCTEYQEQRSPKDAGLFQSRKPTLCHAKLHNNLSAATEPSVNTCFGYQSKKSSVTTLPRYTAVESVTQTTTLCDQVRVTPCHSVGVTKEIKRDSHVETGTKPGRDAVRRDIQSLNTNLHKSFTIFSSTNQLLKHGIKRPADECSETLLSKRFRIERQN